MKLRRTPYGLEVVSPDDIEWFRSLPLGSEIEVDRPTRKRTDPQNNSLHLWCEMLAEEMNAHGITLKVLMEAKEVDIPMTKELVKRVIWSPVQEAIEGEAKTSKAKTTTYNKVYQALCITLPDKLGITAPAWPTRFGEE